MRYFNNISTLEGLRRQYKELLKKYHPDNANGSEEATKTINAEYDSLFKALKDKHEHKQTDTNSNTDKADYNNMKWNCSEDAKLREMLSKIITFKDIRIEIIGNWLWCFDSY